MVVKGIGVGGEDDNEWEHGKDKFQKKKKASEAVYPLRPNPLSTFASSNSNHH